MCQRDGVILQLRRFGEGNPHPPQTPHGHSRPYSGSLGVAIGLQERNEMEPAADTGVLEHLPWLGAGLCVLCSAAGW